MAVIEQPAKSKKSPAASARDAGQPAIRHDPIENSN
jgi:hypothetical protein